ncbi:competence type IV pilus minor pilin ComGD [Anaerobacillus isosaccharinicus]|uniref:GspH/FimT family protein n=1 Tax=Anaerobacillus isosaccharinicus TaxID=1532552 RepID=A0A1S2M248_9BACI|nr:competence type IV pilus minor pilin ComGD [Anaerobacillus isosaccharinicus]MBA5585585.1 GspH/FimT family protein [Anaerobacillus isosaccharinicus]QOY36102.1 GspH/FimT family protein [Anaerobacillus isosaccharinicus]
MKLISFLQNEKGHTLIEMTLVLVIFAVATTIPLVKIESTYDAGKREQFIYQLQQDLYYAQQMAISNQLTTTVVFLNADCQYYIRQGGKIILKREFQHPETTVRSGTISLTDISFLANGNAQKSGSLTIIVGDHRYRLVMLLGMGRFYIEKL